MFYKNLLKTKKSNEKTFEFDMFSSSAQTSTDESLCNFNLTKECYNFKTESGALVCGYGFEPFKSPLNKTDLNSESVVEIRGNEVSALWDFEWYDQQNDENKYYCMYFNDEMKVCYDNLFGSRPTTLLVNTNFTETPIGMKYKIEGIDSMIFSGEGENLLVLYGQSEQTSETAPQMISICAHYGRFFAITKEARGRLVYSDNLNLLEWSDELTKNLDFSDARGNLTKLITFNDYIFIFREYGITKISEYSSDSEFSISHLYQSDSYIYPNSIAHSGDKIFFLEKSGLKSFNGSSVKSIDLPEVKLLSKINNNCFGQCFEGKYFLACKIDFSDDIGGIDETGFLNNALLIYDDNLNHVDIIRGVNVRSMLALNNPYKSKLIACFYGENKGAIGQLSSQNKLFNDFLPAKWTSVKTQLGFNAKMKKINNFTIKTAYPCSVKIKSEKESKTFFLNGSDVLQFVKTNIYGKEFQVTISSDGEAYISSFVLNAKVED